MAGGGRGGRSGGVPTGATDIGGRIIDQNRQQQGPDINIYIDGVDPLNTKHQRLIGEVAAEWNKRTGGSINYFPRGSG